MFKIQVSRKVQKALLNAQKKDFDRIKEKIQMLKREKGDCAMTKTEKYSNLNHKYLKEADALLEKGDYVQASEKLWGAAASIVKSVAARRGINLKSHDRLYRFVNTLSIESKDPELVKSFGLASFLHQNFYEDWLPKETVLVVSFAVKQLVEKLESKQFIPQNG